MKTIRLRSIAAVLLCTVLLSVLPAVTVDAATKAPATPAITSITASSNTVKLAWSKASRAKKYEVALRSADKTWNYWKKVKKTASNKKKYTKENVYKVVSSGKYYKVYRYQYKYTVKKTTTALKWTYTGSYDTTYYFSVRGKNTKTGKWSETMSVKTGINPNIEVPMVDEMTEAEAKAALENLGLKVEVEYEYFTDGDDIWEDYEPGQVYFQEPDAGDMVKRGSTVTIIVVKSASSCIMLDDYTYWNIEDVEAELKELGAPYEIKYKDVFEDQEGQDYDEGEVYSQSTDTLNEGETLILTVIRYKDYGNLEIPEKTIDLYGLNSGVMEVIGDSYANSGFKDTYTLSTGSNATYSITYNGGNITVNKDGLITANKKTWYSNGVSASTRKPDDMTGITVSERYSYGSSTVRVLQDGKVANVIVNVVNYANLYADQQVDELRTQIFTADMTDEQKARTATKYVAQNYDYDAHYSGYVSELIYGGGDCWANSALIKELLTKEGIDCHTHFVNGSGMSGHRNLAVQIGNDTLLCDAGYSDDKPRTYSCTLWKNGYHSVSNGTGTIAIDGYDGFTDSSLLEIPSEIDGKQVTEIRDNTNSHLLMGYRMFSSHPITEVNIPATVTKINENAFYDSSSNLTAIHVAGDNPSYADSNGVLYTKDMSKLLYVPTNYTGTLNIESESVSKQAAFGCQNITELHLGKNLRSLDDRVVWYCKNIEKISLDPANPYLALQGDAVYSKDLKTLYFVNPGLTGTLDIPAETVTITPYAAGYRNITGVSGGENIQTIGEAAFWNCADMTSIPDFANLTNCEIAAFANTGLKGDVTLNMSDIPDNIFASTSLHSVTITDPNATFGNGCFMTSVIIRGHAGSTAETFAKKYNLSFESID